jgi:hypothetical protein
MHLGHMDNRVKRGHGALEKATQLRHRLTVYLREKYIWKGGEVCFEKLN